jgi:hypothetical protein
MTQCDFPGTMRLFCCCSDKRLSKNWRVWCENKTPCISSLKDRAKSVTSVSITGKGIKHFVTLKLVRMVGVPSRSSTGLQNALQKVLRLLDLAFVVLCYSFDPHSEQKRKLVKEQENCSQGNSGFLFVVLLLLLLSLSLKFSAAVQTGPGAHSASYTRGIKSFPGVKRLGRGLKPPTHSSAEGKERVELCL